MTKTVKIIILSLPVLIGGGVYYWWFKKYSIPTKTAIPQIGGNGPAGKSQPAAAASTSACTYPLQQGSINTCVGQLQDALGINIDNNFGGQTYDALLEQAGLTSIASASQLSQVIDSILSNDEGSVVVNTELSNTLLSSYQGGSAISMGVGLSPYTYLKAVNYTVFKQVGQDSTGSWYSVGFQLPLSAGKNIPLSTYQPIGVDPDTGNLIVNCTSGVNQGYWSANPNDLSLV